MESMITLQLDRQFAEALLGKLGRVTDTGPSEAGWKSDVLARFLDDLQAALDAPADPKPVFQ